jgi:hypothetical protein
MITFHGQEVKRNCKDIENLCIEFFGFCSLATIGKDVNRLKSIIEVTCYIDMSKNCTLHFQGAKNVEGAHNGY